MRLKGKVTAITGAGRGIGRAAAELFAREGATVLVLELSADDGREVDRVITQAGGRAHFIRTDVADAASVASDFAEIDRQCGWLDVLYNNISVFLGGLSRFPKNRGAT
jgi:NAD(P)-dependent dehydrogenase (short-subunit alcohol dehydrogenase family)